jgi:integrase
MRGNVTRRGKTSWRLKFDLGRDPATGRRQTRFVTVRGKRQDAERELTRLVAAAHDGTLVDPSKITVAEYLRQWLGGITDLAPKTLERYRELVERTIIPHLGATALQKLRPAQISDWHGALAKAGGRKGRPLSPSTVRHAHRVLNVALRRAASLELTPRNVVALVRPPKAETAEVEILTLEQIGQVLAALRDDDLYPIAAVALGSGTRRGELLALRWGDIDLESGQMRIERSLEETGKRQLRFKSPKTAHGRRTVSLPAMAIEALREHRRRHLEMRLALGLGGRPEPDALVFAKPDGSPLPPDWLSGQWRRVVAAKKLPQVTFHALRHTHASTLLASGLDIVRVSRRLGHGSPAITLTVYSHLIRKTDADAADAIEAAMRTGAER